MILKQFRFQLAMRLAGLFTGLLLLAFGIAENVRASLLAVLVVLIILLAVSLTRFINRTNRDLESFLAGLKFGDFQQTFSIAHLGPSFLALEDSLKSAVLKFKAMRTEKERQAVFNQALIEHIPIPLFTVHGDGRVDVLNNATRRTFNIADITNTGELGKFGAGFQRDVLQVQPGEALLTTIERSGVQEYFILAATKLVTDGQTQKLVSLQNVQGQIDATELATWQNLLRVTSHEIINSLAPVSSSAQGAKMLVDEALAEGVDDAGLREDMQDIQSSLETVQRRSEGLSHFIKSYRQLSRMPQPDKKKIPLAQYFEHLGMLVRDELSQKNISLELACHPQSLSVLADRDMLDQASINLVRNATEALGGTPGARIEVRARADERQRTVLEFNDNGPGIPADLTDRVFLPFFTSKGQGSGIGLALVRYIMLSHGGTATYEPGRDGGATIRLVF